jgi:hypothetical protein
MRIGHLAALALSYWTLGCTIHPVFNLTPIRVNPAAAVAIDDERPAIERDSEILSLFVTSCAYGIAQMGDDKTIPDRTTYLKQALGGSLGDRLTRKAVTLKSFAIYRNNQASLRNGNPAKAGLLTAAITNSIECYAKKEQRGGYDPGENPDGTNAVVIDLVVSVGAKDFRARVVEPAPGTASDFPGTPDLWERAVDLAMKKVVDRLVSQIRMSEL